VPHFGHIADKACMAEAKTANLISYVAFCIKIPFQSHVYTSSECRRYLVIAYQHCRNSGRPVLCWFQCFSQLCNWRCHNRKNGRFVNDSFHFRQLHWRSSMHNSYQIVMSHTTIFSMLLMIICVTNKPTKSTAHTTV